MKIMTVNESFPNPAEVNWSPMEEYSTGQVLQKPDPFPPLKGARPVKSTWPQRAKLEFYAPQVAARSIQNGVI
jgi:hypothetical protein